MSVCNIPTEDPKAVICLMGPTASGKTQLALEWAQQMPCEIISVDSAMVYRGMDIGTAKPTMQERAEVPHHLIDIRDPSEAYSAADFCQDAQEKIASIQAKGKTPLLVGGTMLYFYALQQGLSTLPTADSEIRARIVAEAQQHGWSVLHDRLREIDPMAAQRIHPNDPQRLQRALEVYAVTGKPLSVLQAEQKAQLSSSMSFYNIGLIPEDRSPLHARIAERWDAMVKEGLIEEVEQLYRREDLHAELPAMRAVGYRQVWRYLAGEYDAQTMREKAIIATRQLAKRQYTWLKKFDFTDVIPENA